MPVILNFNKEEKEELKRFWSSHEIITKGGSEGKPYLIGKNIYKIYNEDYETETPICKSDLPLDSFLFPEEIYTYNNKIFAYKTPYIPNNQFEIKTFRNWVIPDIKKVKKALIPFVKDVYVLSRNNINAIDLVWHNTLFDGERIYIVDTIDYQIVDEDPEEDNYKSLKNIIICLMLNAELAHNQYNVKLSDEDLKEYKNLPLYIKEIYKKTKEEYKDKEIQKIKK